MRKTVIVEIYLTLHHLPLCKICPPPPQLGSGPGVSQGGSWGLFEGVWGTSRGVLGIVWEGFGAS